MIPLFKNFMHLPLRLQRLFITGMLIFASFMMSAQAATVSVSNYPLFLLSQAVTEGAPSAKQLLQAGEVGHHGSISPGDIKAIQDSKRSEERRVGKECRCRWSRAHEKRKSKEKTV